jgi:hypothetical protein
VQIELDGEGVDLALELAQASREPVALFAERLGQGHHRLDEPLFPIFAMWGVGHRCPPASARGPGSKTDAVAETANGADLVGERVADLTG